MGSHSTATTAAASAKGESLRFDREFLDRLRSARRVVLMTHVDPDADGLGSQVGLLRALRASGHEAVIVNADPLPDRYAFLGPTEIWGCFPQDRHWLVGADLGLVLDANALDRAGPPAAALRDAGVELLCVDHHVAGAGALSGVIASELSSTGEATYHLLTALGWPIDEPIATALYAAISFDTGSFRFLRGRSQTLRVAASLLDAGADDDRIQRALYGSHPFDEVRLHGRLMSRIERSADGRIAHLVAEPALWRDIDPPADAVSEVMPMVIGIEGVEIAVVFRPGPGSDEWKASLRSKGADVGGLARRLGGGGHRVAAGMTLSGSIASVRSRLLDDLRALLAPTVPASPAAARGDHGAS